MKKIIVLALIAGLMSQSAAFSQGHKMESKTKVIAHRGAWKNTQVPENSLAALQAAIKMKCYGSEFDVHMSADSVLYVHHDHDIKGTDIETNNSTDLDKIQLSNGEPLPRLESYLKAGKKQKRTRLVLEIKASKQSKEHSLALAKKCVELVERLKVEAITDYISFDYDVCLLVKKINPKAEVLYLSGDKSPEVIKASGLDGVDYHYSAFKKNPTWIAEFKQLGLITNAWTVNDKSTMKDLMDQGLDYMTTNEPELLFELLK
ncbi:glycerophosphoryl diester phosphodiesterase [Dyadobacter jejuensis]|uniref:Glycerophosphoryl diester phosphodiesterase n=1 Tax=Dyadobacter jejuensis TaxID=1082580 RepID=A0A316ALM6_9BACT|nr:glycerophosphodiester phosphodiesterase family protein [Dyadobacter jejuensis]PWJ58308.1 glycerophosphoryl diester phosphodiesterase [Dyadobacter jejuensis]